MSQSSGVTLTVLSCYWISPIVVVKFIPSIVTHIHFIEMSLSNQLKRWLVVLRIRQVDRQPLWGERIEWMKMSITVAEVDWFIRLYLSFARFRLHHHLQQQPSKSTTVNSAQWCSYIPIPIVYSRPIRMHSTFFLSCSHSFNSTTTHWRVMVQLSHLKTTSDGKAFSGARP